MAIIGSGIVGLSAALALLDRQPQLSVAVIERGVLPEGASTRNAGFACFGSMTELLDDLETMPESDVFALVERRFKGLQRLRKRVGDDNLRYEGLGGYEIFLTAMNKAEDKFMVRTFSDRSLGAYYFFDKHISNL